MRALGYLVERQLRTQCFYTARAHFIRIRERQSKKKRVRRQKWTHIENEMETERERVREKKAILIGTVYNFGTKFTKRPQKAITTTSPSEL